MNKFQSLFKLFSRHQLTTGRLVLIGGFTFVLLSAALAINRSPEDLDRSRSTLDFMAGMGLGLAVPIIALVLASSTLGDLVEDETLVYLWHRPSSRWMIAVSAWLSSTAVTLPATVLPLGLSALLASGGSMRVAFAVAAASALAVVAYCGLFTLAGVMVRKSLVWGLLYVFIWETLLTSLFGCLGRLSVRSYAAALSNRLAGVGSLQGLHSVPASVIACLIIGLGCVGLTTWRLNKMDIA